MNYQIRPSTLFDKQQILRLLELAFKGDVESKLVATLLKGNTLIADLSLVLEIKNQILGYILFTRVLIEPSNDDINLLALAPMAVLPGYQDRGLGKALVWHGLKEARRMDFDGVVVLGHRDYYPRFGFKPASRWKITCPWPVPDEVFMVAELRDRALNDVSGLIKYPDPFLAF